MKNENLKYTVETATADPELKAHIYQQLTEFEPYLLPGSHVTVSINNKQSKSKQKRKKFTVTFSLAAEGSKITGKGSSDNVFQAAINAKNTLLRKFDNIQDEVISPLERESEINEIVKGNSVLH